jgi:hypothetical protein
MTHTAEHQGGNSWIVTETDDADDIVKRKKVFCKADENTAEDAIAVATAEPVGD